MPESKDQECHAGELSRKLVWDSDKIEDFHSELSSSNVHIQQMTSNADIEPIDDVVRSFTHFLHDKAFDVFGKTQSR